MKTKILLFVVLFLFHSAVSIAAQNSPSIWTVDFVKTKEGQQENYLKFIEENWAQARAFMKEKGIVRSYQVLSLSFNQQMDWDVLLMTEYTDNAGYEQREAVFKQFTETRRPVINAARINVREISEIKFSRKFTQPISSETARLMLSSQTTSVEEAAARLPLEYYLKGHATGDGRIMKKAFQPKATIQGINGGKIVSRTLEEYVNNFSGKPAADEAKRNRRIETIEVNGNAATAKLIFDYPDITIVDYLLLLKIDDEWKIVSKIFQTTPKQKMSKN